MPVIVSINFFKTLAVSLYQRVSNFTALLICLLKCCKPIAATKMLFKLYGAILFVFVKRLLNG